MLRVHALTVDRGGCFYYRVKQPLRAMRDRGHWTSWGGVIDEGTFERANVLVAQLLNFASTSHVWKEWCERGDKLCVWEADDDVFSVHRHPGHGAAYDDPETIPRMKEMISASHLVTVTTPELARVYAPYNPNVVVLPNYVPDWMVQVPIATKTERRLRLGYTGSSSHVDDILGWGPVLDKWMSRNFSRTELVFYGTDERPQGIPSYWKVTTYPWRKMTEDYLRSISMDVGIAPLEDTEFNRGKSGIKALEYGALGIPAIVADFPQYRAVVKHRTTGFLVKSHSQWLDALHELWDNPSSRLIMGRMARNHVADNFLMGDNVWRWERAYTDAMERMGISHE